MRQKPETTPSGKPRYHNEDLPAGSPMYFYCDTCGELADVKPESYSPHIDGRPKHICDACAAKVSHL